jgi:hypothetical protein
MTERQMKEVNRQKSTTASTEKNVFQEEEAAFLLCLLCIYADSRASVVLCKEKSGLLSLGVRFFSGEVSFDASKEEEEQQQQ